MKFTSFGAKSIVSLALSILNWSSTVTALADTDTITSCGDNSRSCYETNHNMDPSVVASSEFGQLWRTALTGNYRNNKEQIFAQPLVFTPAGSTTQYVYISTTQNKVYKINAKTGVIVAERTLAVPFLTSDLDGCVDINPLVGNTATGVIDADTETWYLTLKTYRDQGDVEKGRLNGRYWVYALDTTTLQDRPNFPVPLEDIPARNNPKRLFKGGNQHQRPALLQHGQFIYAGFASHCVQYNFSGWLMGWNKDTGAIVESFATQGGPESIDVRGGGIWMSGGGIASDNRGSMWFATGNGYASQLHGTPVPGRQPPSSLEEAAVHGVIQEDGTINVADFFMPYEKEVLDGADQDLATSPLNISPFSCPNAARIGIITGKNGKTYFLNLDNLGGYCMSPTKQDAILGVYQNENSVYAGAGVFPISKTSGYVYINIIKYPTRIFQFSCDASGNPQFVPVAYTREKVADVLGASHGTTTSFPGKANSGLFWVSDVQGFNLRIYRAIPENGYLTTLRTFTIPGVTKFQKPSFGNGIAYVGTTQGFLYAFGSPVNAPLECSEPYDFGNENVGSTTAAKTISCRAKIALTVTGAALSSTADFRLGTINTGNVAAGQNFTFTAQFAPSVVGSRTATVYVNTTNSIAGYSTQVGISLSGTGRSTSALLAVRPETVTFAGYTTGGSASGVDQSFMIANDGDSALTITSYQFSLNSATGPWTNPQVNGNSQKIGAFTFYDLPTFVSANSQSNIRVNFFTEESGNYKVYLKINSSAGSKTATILATAADPPRAVVEFESPSGGWVPFDPNTPFSFGNVLQQNTVNLKLRVTNAGGPNAGSLSITVSKPPVGVSGIVGAVNGVDLGEGTLIAAGQSETATLYCSVPRTQVNTDQYKGSAVWTMNINDPSFGKQVFKFECNAYSQQYGPMVNSTTGLYRYLGCYKEWNPGRQLKTQIYTRATNDNKMCIEACSAAGWTFAGTQYHTECWCGNDIPKQMALEQDCNFGCAASDAFTCGGNGYNGGGAYISLFARSDRYTPGQQPSSTTGGSSTPTSTANPAVYKGYVHQGCWSETSGARAIANLIAANSSMHIEMCIDAAIQRGYNYCGVQYGQECFAGTTIRAESTQLPIAQCDMPCPGNTLEFCGAGNKFNFYKLDPSASSTTTTTSRTTTISTTPGSTGGSTTTTPTTTSTTTTSSTTTTVVTGPTIVSNYNGFTFEGCWTDATTNRTLAGWGLDPGPDMTVEKCIDYCAPTKQFIGLEDGRECWCGNEIRRGNAVPTTECATPCSGAAGKLCGGPARLAIYKKAATTTTTTTTTSRSLTTSSTTVATTTTTTSSTTTSTTTTSSTTSSTTTSSTTTTTSVAPTPTTVQNYGGFTFQSCWTDRTDNRALTGWGLDPGPDMTVDKCIDFCGPTKEYIGLEDGRECWCGNSILSGEAAPETECSTSCSGNANQLCGGPSRLAIYKRAANGISSSSTTTTTTTTSSTTTSSSTTTTTSSTTTTTTSPTTTTTTTTTTSPTTTTTSRTTTTTTTTSSTTSPTTTTTSRTTTTSSTTSSTTTSSTTTSRTTTTTLSTTTTTTTTSRTTTASPSSTANPWQYLGCYVDSAGSRTLSNRTRTLSTTTIDNCKEFCLGIYNLPFAGVENANQCFCADSIGYNRQPGQTGCNKPCAGDASQICGGSSRLDIFEFEDWTPTVIPQTAGGWRYNACWTEITGRAIRGYVSSATDMTVEKCVSICQGRSYTVAGLQNRNECHCGNANLATVKPGDDQCNGNCVGDATEYCGAPNRLQVYLAT